MKKFLSMMCLVMLGLTMSSCSTTKVERDVAQIDKKAATEYSWTERQKFYDGER